MSEERPKTCKKCGAPEVWCTCPPCGKPAVFKVVSPKHEDWAYVCAEHLLNAVEVGDITNTDNVPADATCGFVCAQEDAVINKQLCDRPALFMVYSPQYPLDPTYSCAEHLAVMVEPGENIVTTENIPAGAMCCFIAEVKDGTE